MSGIWYDGIMSDSTEDSQKRSVQTLEKKKRPQERAAEHSHASHTHVLPDGTVCEHSHDDRSKVPEDSRHVHGQEHTHGHSHAHGHAHTHGQSHGHVHTNTRAVLNRMARIIGHMESIRRMVEDGRDCTEVLIQLSAVKSALNNTGKIILQDHIEHRIVDAIESGDHEALEELNKAIDQFIK